MAELLDLAERIAASAEAGEQVEAFVGRGRTTNVKAYEGEVEAFTSAESFGVGIRVVVGKRQGFAWAGSLDEKVVIETLHEARDNAAYSEEDEYVGLAEPDGVQPVEAPNLWRPALLEFPTEDKIALALELERAVRARDDRITGVRQASYGDSAGEAAVATSTGISVWSRGTFCHLSASALARQGDETQIGGGVDVGRQPDELSVELAAADAVDRATRLLGATKAPSQRLTIVLEPRLAATLLGIVGGMLTGDVVLKGRSPFADRMGDAIASPLLSFVDDPTDARSMAADSHDGEGLATRRNALIAGGVLRGFLHDSYTGRRAGVASTGSAVRGFRSTPSPGAQALAVAPGHGTHEELLAGIDHGLLVQSMNGLHSGVNPVSGDFSVGAEGLMIRGGALAEPVREITIASTLQRLLLDVRAVGADLEWLPSGSGGVTLVIDDVSLSGS
ncbi:MAG: PmbA protein [Acidimicrobiaceae bacterium]